MDWDDYEVFDPLVDRPLKELPRAEAKKAYDWLMQSKPARIEALRRLLAANGVELEDSDDGLQRLNDWFRTNVESDPDQPLRPDRLMPEWYSVANDTALYLGDVFIKRYPHLRWKFCTGGMRNVMYQRHVIAGVKVPKDDAFDIDMLVAAYGSQAARGWPVDENEFLKLIRSVAIREARYANA
jgi:hypothetical protein